MMAPCIFHVDLDAFFVSVEQALNPELRGRPVVVGGDPPTRGVVASASYEARAYGLYAGLPLTTAHHLCPQAVFLRGSFARYRDASERFMNILADLTPDLEPLGIDEAYLDLTGFEPLYGPPRQVAFQIKNRVKKELGITASVGIAPSKVIAKIASDLAKPDGLIEVQPGDEKVFLAPLPVSLLPCVGPKTERQLKAMGVSTIGQLASVPFPFLRQAFGAAGTLLHRYANGIDRRRVELLPPAKSVSRSTTFIEDTLDRPFLRATLGYLSERVGAALRRENKRARCITLKLRYADFETITRSSTLKEPTDADQVIFEVGREFLERALQQRRKKVRLLGIGVSSLVGGERQLHMFEPSRDRMSYLDRALDRLRGKFGFTSIQRGRTLPLKEVFPTENGDYVLKTSSLSR